MKKTSRITSELCKHEWRKWLKMYNTKINFNYLVNNVSHMYNTVSVSEWVWVWVWEWVWGVENEEWSNTNSNSMYTSTTAQVHSIWMLIGWVARESISCRPISLQRVDCTRRARHRSNSVPRRKTWLCSRLSNTFWGHSEPSVVQCYGVSGEKVVVGWEGWGKGRIYGDFEVKKGIIGD